MNIEKINEIKELCKTKTIFRASQFIDPKWFEIVNLPISDPTRKLLKQKYGNDVEIFNDVFEQGKIPSVF